MTSVISVIVCHRTTNGFKSQIHFYFHSSVIGVIPVGSGGGVLATIFPPHPALSDPSISSTKFQVQKSGSFLCPLKRHW